MALQRRAFRAVAAADPDRRPDGVPGRHALRRTAAGRAADEHRAGRPAGRRAVPAHRRSAAGRPRKPAGDPGAGRRCGRGHRARADPGRDHRQVEGPLSALADLYVGPNAYSDTSPNRDLADILMSVMPALLVLVLAAGLRRGRRFAWWAAMVFHVLLLVLGTFYAIDYYHWAVDNDLLDQGFELDGLAGAAGAAAGADHHHAAADPPVVHRAGTGRDLPQVRPDRARASWSACGRSTSSSDPSSPTSSPRPPSFGRLARRLPDPVAAQRLSVDHRPRLQPIDGVARFITDWIPVVVLGRHPARSAAHLRRRPGGIRRRRTGRGPGCMLEQNGSNGAVLPDHLGRQQLLVLQGRELLRRLPGRGRGGDHHRRSGRAAATTWRARPRSSSPSATRRTGPRACTAPPRRSSR